MPKIIKNNAVVDDNWGVLAKDSSISDVPASGNFFVPLTTWLENKSALLARGDFGVWLDCDQPANDLEQDVESLKHVAINFPVFSDGRGYSYAEVLRRFGYSGELRAIGDVLKDQLYFYKRVGFDSYALREDLNIEEAVAHLNDFSDAYQVSNSLQEPVFLRR
ncbi:hypothetical protein SIN8267_00346 [Sinobacterium norvegicum]|uniref:Oxidoreductase n=1 Tax=Sinobacterium norvegicum TaxID=1641715 RepID=A0ABM9ABC9_9GAMM|nr:DUF934 domain-containing protein [Sinobacterium norvegicum]CAH0990254.1 hypothetical protein SIN8267_00346 [Sinobacterium norvegicum]